MVAERGATASSVDASWVFVAETPKGEAYAVGSGTSYEDVFAAEGVATDRAATGDDDVSPASRGPSDFVALKGRTKVKLIPGLLRMDVDANAAVVWSREASPPDARASPIGGRTKGASAASSPVVFNTARNTRSSSPTIALAVVDMSSDVASSTTSARGSTPFVFLETSPSIANAFCDAGKRAELSRNRSMILAAWSSASLPSVFALVNSALASSARPLSRRYAIPDSTGTSSLVFHKSSRSASSMSP